ncbi:MULTISPECIES: MarR family winged helix-turn-helix transcriptional regulator [unclassified Variovorax]|uniref:MarR family winged helix-turn-helix transcriptional regulator n=1 Tax=unclassified Variovorax TaxID=663243 RepID=UPI0008C0098C|nr:MULTISPECIES: MarR family transcriptional regulator [unclassified Variovorax]SEJ01659.1 DNA-binding transcriptional regulator, MarR family [Variovorax sp. OK202]SFB91525.1 DNA-binding transcriptional regulator, MarR family [Variovorax sp. OK212]
MPKSRPQSGDAPNPAFELPRVARAGMRELHPQDGALLLMHFAFRGLVVKADAFLAEQGLSRVHHRLLYAVARAEGISIGQLIELLGVTKQAMHRPLKFLQDEGYVVAERDANQHRSKKLRLTELGARTEKLASAHEREAMELALQTVSANEQDAWRKVMTALARLA